MERLIDLMKVRQESGVKVTVITESTDVAAYEDPCYVQTLIDQMTKAGIVVKEQPEVTEHFAVIDQNLVWYGGMNLLGKEDIWDNLIRVRDKEAAAELLELAETGMT